MDINDNKIMETTIEHMRTRIKTNENRIEYMIYEKQQQEP